MRGSYDRRSVCAALASIIAICSSGFVFAGQSLQAGETVFVTAERTPIMSGKTVLKTATKAESFLMEKVEGEWILVKEDKPSTHGWDFVRTEVPIRGWIRMQDVIIYHSTPSISPIDDPLDEHSQSLSEHLEDHAANGVQQPQAVITCQENNMSYSPDGEMLATWSGISREFFSYKEFSENRSSIQNVKLWRVTDGGLKSDFGPGPWHGVMFSPDGKLLVLWSEIEITIWDVVAGRSQATLPQRNVWWARFVDNGRKLVTATGGEHQDTGGNLSPEPLLLRFWDVASWTEIKTGLPDGGLSRISILSPDGRTVVTANAIKNPFSVIVRDTTSGKERSTLDFSVAPIGLAFTPDNKALITLSMPYSRSPATQHWDLTSGKEIFRGTLPEGAVPVGFYEPVPSMSSRTIGGFLPVYRDLNSVVYDGFLLSPVFLTDAKLLFWDWIKGKSRAQFEWGSQRPEAEMWLVNDRVLVMQRQLPPTGTVNLWNTDTWTTRATLELPGPVICTDIARDADLLVVVSVSGDKERDVTFWELTTQKKRLALAERKDFTCVAISPEGKILATGTRSPLQPSDPMAEISIWDASRGTHLQTVAQVDRTVKCVTFSPDGNHLAAICEDLDSVSIWNTASWKEEAVLKVSGSANCVTFSPDSKLLAVGARGNIFDRNVAFLPDLGSPTKSRPKFSPPWDRGELSLWHVSTGKLLNRHGGYGGFEPLALAFTSDGLSLLALTKTSRSQNIEALDLKTGKVREEFNRVLMARLGGQSKERLVLSPDSHSIAVNGLDGMLRVLDPTKMKFRKSLGIQNCNGTTLQFTSDGKTLVAGGRTPVHMQVELVELDSGRRKVLADTVVMRTNDRLGVFSPDGRLFATTRAETGTDVVLRDTSTSEELTRLPSGVDVQFSPTSQTVATVGRGLIKIWNLADLVHATGNDRARAVQKQ